MSGDHERVELAEKRERGTGACAPGHVSPHAGQRESGLRDEAEPPELGLDERGRPELLEAELRVTPDLLADRDDRLGVALDRLVDALLELLPRHPLGT